MANSKEYNDGYNSAIEAIKASLNKNNTNTSSKLSNKAMDPRMKPIPQNGQNSDSSSQTNGGHSPNNANARDSITNKNQGVVRPEDCLGPLTLDDIPDTSGVMVDEDTGEQIAKEEGYQPESGSSEQISKQWQDEAKKMADKLKNKGNNAGNFVEKINNLYKVSHDWKKELQKIVGYSISQDNTRRAFANKNTLLSQNRLARTDKTLFDAIDYIVAFIDSSGSMTLDQLKMCLSTVYAVALAKKPIKIFIVQCDTKIQDIQEFNSLPELKKYFYKATVKGRGGTELKPCWELLSKNSKFNKRRSELVFVFTDGYLTQYKRDPKTMQNLCWVIIDNSSFELQYKDANTKVVRIKSEDIK